MAHQCKIASCSQEKVRSALKRKILDNDLVSSSSGIVQSRTINSNFTRPTKPFFKNNSQNVSQIGYSLKCWSFHKASSVLARIIIYSSSLWISATSSFLFLFFFRRRLAFIAPGFACNISWFLVTTTKQQREQSHKSNYFMCT